MTVFHSQGVGKPILVENLLAKYGPYKVGRWCKAPEEPDRCDFCLLADIKPAVGFVVDEDGWRHGYCSQHQAPTYEAALDIKDEEFKRWRRGFYEEHRPGD